MTGFVYWKTHICVCVAQLTAKQRRLQPPATSNTHSNVPMCSFCRKKNTQIRYRVVNKLTLLSDRALARFTLQINPRK